MFHLKNANSQTLLFSHSYSKKTHEIEVLIINLFTLTPISVGKFMQLTQYDLTPWRLSLLSGWTENFW